MAIGVFGLQVAYRLKRLEVMSTDDTHGWFGAGYNSPPVTRYSLVDRIDFSNDTGTANIRGSLSLARNTLAATGNSNYGWFGGGSDGATPGIFSTVDRIDFSNDSSTALVRGPLSVARERLSATGNSNYGWFGGGSVTSPAPLSPGTSTVDRIDFSNDSGTSSPRGPLSSVRKELAATGNSNYGWFSGGQFESRVDRIDFSNDSPATSVRGSLSSARQHLTATGNSNYGWWGGGGVFPTFYSTVDRIDFSNDSSTASVRGPLSLARYGLAATGNSNYGWFGGGYYPAKSTVDRIDFSNDSITASPRGPLSAARYVLAATSGQAKGPAIKLQKAGNYGWFGGGTRWPAPAIYSTVDRIDFSNDSVTASVRGPLSSEGQFIAATGNSNYGWFGGGYGPAVDRIDFSNDSSTASVRGPLSASRYALAATGNSNYGWFGGGSIVTKVDRIDFSNDSTTASPRGPLTTVRGELAATGNSNYGWFGGGTPRTSKVDRIDFSNDNATASPRGPLSSARYGLAATGNSNYGWFGGGGVPQTATVDRIDFSNDNTTASVRGPLGGVVFAPFPGIPNTGQIYRLTATGNSNYGWFGGGYLYPRTVTVSRVQRINFANDSVSASIRSPLSSARYGMGATSNTPT